MACNKANDYEPGRTINQSSVSSLRECTLAELDNLDKRQYISFEA